ncbi:PREDICTED: TCF3 fusion partner [Nanorana parkeri]|uniref:TCF3 fusion partner n=1 Tax=Nanorana parkeri TaxID=125878 RepID=UPI00085408E1|nr:PREDICTED: TCF3 fusion partner [Nanorana parkeri]
MAVNFEEFSVPPGSELALPPLFGGNILESELETEVEFVDGGLAVENIQDEEEEEAQHRMRQLNKSKFLSLNRRCKEIEQVNERILNRLHQVQKIMRRLKQERRCLMKILDAYGDGYRRSHLTYLLEDEGTHTCNTPTPANSENYPPESQHMSQCLSGPPLGLEVASPCSPSFVEEPPVKKMRKHKEEKVISPALLSTEPLLAQVKIEEDYLCDGGEELNLSWHPLSPRDKILQYTKFSSPGPCTDFD